MKKVYFAGGWFSPAQEEEHTRVLNTLRDYCKDILVFNPREHGELSNEKSNHSSEATKIFHNNVGSIRDCDFIVCITDYKDMGTIWEAGCAYALNKQIVYYCETLGDRPFNVMLAKSGLVTRNEVELIETVTRLAKDVTVTNQEYKGDFE